jgi:4-amino-4-deoxy-L-arabinose transferase-like glycosyltransferase
MASQMGNWDESPVPLRYIRSVRELVRNHLRFFFWATIAAVALRLLFIFRFPALLTDSFVYGDIAKNWLQHGIYGLSGPDEITPTYIRLPGYPAFLAAVFAVFGMEHYRAVLIVQMFVDIGTCFVIADMARRTLSARAAKAVFVLAALCPFLANYAAAALTETLEIFFTALALDLAVAGLAALDSRRIRCWLGCGLAIAATILLRPDGGLLLIAIEAYLLVVLLRSWRDGSRAMHVLRTALAVGLIALTPLIPWGLRNLHTLHRFEPLAPRYANQEDEFVPMGFNRWVKTWMEDYVSVEEIYWEVPGDNVPAEKAPARAFDSEAQRQQTLQLLAEYNEAQHFTPELDSKFAALAEQRIHNRPLRYYFWLPAVRIVDMWLRPRTELLPSDSRWWEFNDDPQWSALAIALGAINLLYIGAALTGLVRSRLVPASTLLLTFVVLRSAFLGSLENPEPRYTLECFPAVIWWISVVFNYPFRPELIPKAVDASLKISI